MWYSTVLPLQVSKNNWNETVWQEKIALWLNCSKSIDMQPAKGGLKEIFLHINGSKQTRLETTYIYLENSCILNCILAMQKKAQRSGSRERFVVELPVGNAYNFSDSFLQTFLLMACQWKRQLKVAELSVTDSPAWSEALNEDDPHAIRHLVCEAHRPINKGSTLLPKNTEIKDYYRHCGKAQRNEMWNTCTMLSLTHNRLYEHLSSILIHLFSDNVGEERDTTTNPPFFLYL